MSLRPEICGFSLAKLRSLLGSRNQDILKTLLTECDQQFVGDDSESDKDRRWTEQVKEVIRRAIMKGAPFPDLDAEDETHVAAMMVLAAHEQSPLPTESSIWKAPVLADLWEAIGEKLPARVAPLYDGMLNGRPLLGKRIDSSWSFYAWLTCQEVTILWQSLETIRRVEPDPTGNGFLGELASWLEQIHKGAYDLWFEAA
jgi:hypothetical protein